MGALAGPAGVAQGYPNRRNRRLAADRAVTPGIGQFAGLQARKQGFCGPKTSPTSSSPTTSCDILDQLPPAAHERKTKTSTENIFGVKEDIARIKGCIPGPGRAGHHDLVVNVRVTALIAQRRPYSSLNDQRRLSPRIK